MEGVWGDWNMEQGAYNKGDSITSYLVFLASL